MRQAFLSFILAPALVLAMSTSWEAAHAATFASVFAEAGTVAAGSLIFDDDQSVSLNGGIATASATVPGYSAQARAQAAPWRNRLFISVSPEGEDDGGASAEGVAAFTENLFTTGPDPTIPFYIAFHVDGQFASPTDDGGNLFFYLAAFKGKALSIDAQSEPDEVIIRSTFGTINFGEDGPDVTPLAFASLCAMPVHEEDDEDSGCATGSYDKTLGLAFDAPTNTDFFVVGYLALDEGCCGDQLDFFNTAKLLFIDAPGADSLIDESGLLTRDANGRYALADASPGAVPEPASWVTMIAGFSLIGIAVRRRSRKMPEAAH